MFALKILSRSERRTGIRSGFGVKIWEMKHSLGQVRKGNPGPVWVLRNTQLGVVFFEMS